jgi:hypothetical protein
MSTRSTPSEYSEYSRHDWRGGNAPEPCTAALRYFTGTPVPPTRSMRTERPGLGGYSAGTHVGRVGLSAARSGSRRCTGVARAAALSHTRGKRRAARLDHRVLRGYSGALGQWVGRRRGRRRGRVAPSRPAQHSIAARCNGTAHRVATQPRIVATPER